MFGNILCGQLYRKLHAGILPVLRFSAAEVRFNWDLAELRESRLHRLVRDLYRFRDHRNLHERSYAAIRQVLQRHRRYLQGLLQWF